MIILHNYSREANQIAHCTKEAKNVVDFSVGYRKHHAILIVSLRCSNHSSKNKNKIKIAQLVSFH